MLTQSDCTKRYGDPTKAATWAKHLVIWDVPTELEIGFIPKRLYCNKDLILPLAYAFANLIDRGHVKELLTWDGCWNVRPIRGYENSNPIRYSLHSWAIAIDLNAATNGLNKKPTLSAGFVKCFTDVGFVWGGNFSRPDGMHFELRMFTPTLPALKLQEKPYLKSVLVKFVQARLKEALKVQVDDDGIFGPKTEELVKRFQMMNGMQPDGVVGSGTLKALGLN